MADSKEDVASKALARLGEPSISSFTEDSGTAEKVNLLYEMVILDLLSAHDWEWATQRADLSVDGGETPVNEWSTAFLLPTLKTLRVGNPLRVFNSSEVNARPFFAYQLQGKWLYTNASAISIEYIERKDETLWPGFFEILAVEALAASLALPVTENQTKEEFHTQKAFGAPSEGGRGGMFGRAVAHDQVGKPTPSFLDSGDPIGNARFGGLR
jgi:hypothetical protein